jgi:hypothetical protein
MSKSGKSAYFRQLEILRFLVLFLEKLFSRVILVLFQTLKPNAQKTAKKRKTFFMNIS